MSYKTKLQTNNNNLEGNNIDLQSILNTINELPAAGGGTEDLDAEITEQEGLIEQIEAALVGKAAGGGKTTKMINIDWSDEQQVCYVDYISNNQLKTVQYYDEYTIEAEGGIIRAYIGEEGYYTNNFIELYNDGNGNVILVATQDWETISLITPLINEEEM